MKIQVLSPAEASFERAPGQDADVFTANLVDERQGGPITIGYGRYGPRESLRETIVVDDVMIVLEGQLTITADGQDRIASPGNIVYMPRGEAVEIRASDEGALTAYVTWPHWKTAQPVAGA